MALENLSTDVQVKLVELAWEAAGRARSGSRVDETVSLFGDALDGFVRACESAGKEKKSQ